MTKTTTAREQLEKEQRFRSHLKRCHTIKVELSRLILALSNEPDRTESEVFVRHALEYIAKANKLLTRNR